MPLCNRGKYKCCRWLHLHLLIYAAQWSGLCSLHTSSLSVQIQPQTRSHASINGLSRRFPALLESRSTETEKVSSIPHPDWTDEHSWTPKMLPWSHLSTERLGERVQNYQSLGMRNFPVLSLHSTCGLHKNMSSQKWSTDHVVISWMDCRLCFFFLKLPK